MIRNWLIRLLLMPFALVYGFFSILYSKLYDHKVLHSVKFSLPVINIGNLSVGGTGKTPHTEYLINLLKPFINIAVLSRGYNRKSRGFQEITVNTPVKTSGDESLLYKKKYPDIGVFVSESRVDGISRMLMKNPQIQTVLLDDAFQHRGITPGLNLLLTEYDRPFFIDFFLPFGMLREWRTAYKRADAIIVTKCPDDLINEQKIKFLEKFSHQSNQKVFFTRYRYFMPYYMYDHSFRTELTSDLTVVLISAIASTSYLTKYLDSVECVYHSVEFTDHHNFTYDDLIGLKTVFSELKSEKKLILTTEKDAIRLNEFRKFIIENQLPLFVLPISVEFLFEQKNEFDSYIKDFLINFKI